MNLRYSLVLLALTLPAQTPDRPARNVTDPGVITTRQQISPAGVLSVFQGRVNGVAFGESSSQLWVLGRGRLYLMDWKENRVLKSLPIEGTAGLQGLAWDAATRTPYFSVVRRNGIDLAGQDGKAKATELGRSQAGGVAVRGGKAVAALTFNNELAVVDLANGSVQKAKTGIAPFGAVLNEDATVAYVSNWGGRVATTNDSTARTGYSPQADQVVIDAKGVASTGTLTRVDLKTMQPTHQIAVGLHPNGMAWDTRRDLLYVANANSDTVSVVNTKTQAVAATIDLRTMSQAKRGVAPGAVALSPDGSRFYVACGGLNAVVVIDAAARRVRGAIPTAWYPSSLDVAPDGRIAVGSMLGAGSGWRDEPSRRHVHANRGSVQVIDVPDDAQLAAYTIAVAENNRLPQLLNAPAAPVKATEALPVPARPGDPSLIEHVVMIVKENRTYDQVFGDLERGNGEPKFVMFGEDVAPNHRKLAREFVLLDNFYATGGNSADGHQWLTQANQTGYTLWPGYGGRSYPYDGSDPIAYSDGGFLWDAALAAKKTVKVFGEYIPADRSTPSSQRLSLIKRWQEGGDFSAMYSAKSPIPALDALVQRNFPAYSNSIPDVVRSQIFLKELAAWETAGKMPNLVLIQLPGDHTFGTSPGTSTPRAMVADNDLAMGRIVEGLTKSKFWPKMAIFITEDDAQDGVDHVDGHRTIGLVVSPYTKRGAVDSTFYAHQSILKTAELMLGMGPLSIFDLIALDMRNSFTRTPDLTPYASVVPKQDLFETNPRPSALRGAARQGALASARMDWSVPDNVPTADLNRILWHAIKGADAKYPGSPLAVFSPYAAETEDEN
jgi:YVTN family beta-propeller protein